MTKDVQEAIDIWETFNTAEVYRRVMHKAEDNGARAEATAEALADLPSVTALAALRANATAVELLTGHRWIVMQAAREEGATWSQIGDALGMSKQAAHDFYRRKVEFQEQYAPQFHDAERGRAVLDQ